MALDFGKTEAEAWTVMKGFAHRVEGDLYNHGREGLITQFRDFRAAHEATEVERQKQHQANITRLNLIIALLGAIAAYIAILLTVHGGFHTAELPLHSTLPTEYAVKDAR